MGLGFSIPTLKGAGNALEGFEFMRESAENNRFLSANLANTGQQIAAALTINNQKREAQEFQPIISQQIQQGYDFIQGGKVGEGMAILSQVNMMAGSNPILARITQEAMEGGSKMADSYVDRTLQQENFRMQQGLMFQRENATASREVYKQKLQSLNKAREDYRQLQQVEKLTGRDQGSAKLLEEIKAMEEALNQGAGAGTGTGMGADESADEGMGAGTGADRVPIDVDGGGLPTKDVEVSPVISGPNEDLPPVNPPGVADVPEDQVVVTSNAAGAADPAAGAAVPAAGAAGAAVPVTIEDQVADLKAQDNSDEESAAILGIGQGDVDPKAVAARVDLIAEARKQEAEAAPARVEYNLGDSTYAQIFGSSTFSVPSEAPMKVKSVTEGKFTLEGNETSQQRFNDVIRPALELIAVDGQLMDAYRKSGGRVFVVPGPSGTGFQAVITQKDANGNIVRVPVGEGPITEETAEAINLVHQFKGRMIDAQPYDYGQVQEAAGEPAGPTPTRMTNEAAKEFIIAKAPKGTPEEFIEFGLQFRNDPEKFQDVVAMMAKDPAGFNKLFAAGLEAEADKLSNKELDPTMMLAKLMPVPFGIAWLTSAEAVAKAVSSSDWFVKQFNKLRPEVREKELRARAEKLRNEAAEIEQGN